MSAFAAPALDVTPKHLLLGFIAAMLSVLVFHQGMVLILGILKLLPTSPWSFRSLPPFGVPAIVNQMFWGGLWGALFAAVHGLLPAGQAWLRGLIFGLLGPMLLGNWLLVPLIKQSGPLFAGLMPMRMLISALIAGAFGIGLGLIYEQLRRRA